MKNFKDLLVWQKAVDLVTFVHNVTKESPDEEKYGITSQMRRSAVSIPSNTAEGHMRTTDKDFRQFISISRGSCAELETQTTIAYELGYIKEEGLYNLLTLKIEEVTRMLPSFYAKL